MMRLLSGYVSATATAIVVCLIGGLPLPAQASAFSTEVEAGTPAVDTRLAVEADPDQLEVSAKPQPHHISVDVELSQVSLINGRVVNVVAGTPSLSSPDVGSSQSNVFRLDSDPDTGYLDGKFAYQIVMLDAPTDFWITGRVSRYQGARAECTVVKGEPGRESTPLSSSPFSCEAESSDPQTAVFRVGLSRVVESSGTLSSTGDLTLTEGTFRQNLPFHIAGATTVTPTSPASFNTVLRSGEQDSNPLAYNQARTEFAYRIVDGGVDTGLWVGGLSTNHRGALWYNPGRHCEIYTDNPLGRDRALDESENLKASSSRYDCVTTGGSVDGNPVHDRAVFSVTDHSGFHENTVIADFKLPKEVALTSGRLSAEGPRGRGVLTLSAPSLTEEYNHHGFYLTPFSNNDSARGSAVFEITMLGVPSGYWIRASLDSGNRYYQDCELFEGDPEAAGSTPVALSPFTCEAARYSTDPVFTFDVRFERQAEASGTITTTGSVSLTEGVYATDVPYFIHGATTVDAAHPTSFDAVLRRGDTNPKFAERARTDWAYRIVDGAGAGTNYWAAGMSSFNGVQWVSDSHCEIYDHNPLGDGGDLDNSTPISDAPYTCETSGDWIYDETKPEKQFHRLHWDATFRVSAAGLSE